VITPQVAAAATDILQDTVLYGTGTAANIGRPQLGKTGTDNDHHDAWFVGAVPQLSAAVWVGYHEGQISMEPPRTRSTVFGGTWPAQIWRLMMLHATSDLPEIHFPTPEVGYTDLAVDVTQDPMCLPNDYTLPNAIETLTFIVGTEPTSVCTTPTEVQEVIVPSMVGFEQTEAMTLLEDAGFFVRVEAEESPQTPGTVLYQSPPGGVPALQTETVTITVAQAPELKEPA
jgi:membrane peptidoglycan carboxypeptidase